MTVLALDIGGTKFAAAAVTADGGMTARAEVPLSGAGSPDRALAQVVEQITARVPADAIEGVGIGSAGPLDVRAGTVSPVNIPRWRDFPLAGAVGRMLPGRPVRLAGDAQCMALGEWWRGTFPADPGTPEEPGAAAGTPPGTAAGAAPGSPGVPGTAAGAASGPGEEPWRPGSRAVLGVVVSTGVGGGFVLDGVPYLGPTGNAGHIGHITVDPGGDPCPCGASGCVETVASGPAMVRWARAGGWTGADARALAASARAGSEIAQAAFSRAADALATAFHTAAALLDLDRVVVGGGVAAAGPVLFGPLRQAVAENAGLGFTRRLRVDATSLGRDAGLLGAAALVLPLRPPAP
ncbi:ROK family protein [Streptosporangium sp. NPDC048047]|uniref:ROK family protein n=1 Tax=Streptosporangium sp. NPDC048047 TaxID=3155748 RepID=UPI003417386A